MVLEHSKVITKNTYPCPAHPRKDLEPMPYIKVADVASIVNFLRALARHNTSDGRFAESLVDQFDSVGFLTPRQLKAARRMYARRSDERDAVLKWGLSHDFIVDDVIVHYASELGTYDRTRIQKCTRCGEVQKIREQKNYSGD
jgi:hypothetical protein